MTFQTNDPGTQDRLNIIIEQQRQIGHMLNMILTALERMNGKSEGTIPKKIDALSEALGKNHIRY